jgi:hypothetical protein
MPRIRRRAALGGIQAFNLGQPGGALNLPPPATRRPTRAALGGAMPRAGRMRLPPALGTSIGARGGAAPAATPRKRTGTSKRKKA